MFAAEKEPYQPILVLSAESYSQQYCHSLSEGYNMPLLPEFRGKEIGCPRDDERHRICSYHMPMISSGSLENSPGSFYRTPVGMASTNPITITSSGPHGSSPSKADMNRKSKGGQHGETP